MKISSLAALTLAASNFNSCLAFAPSSRLNGIIQQRKTISNLFATVEDEKTETKEVATSSKDDGGNIEPMEIDPDAEGLPWWWDLVWKLDVMKPGEPGTDCTFGDSANVLKNNIEQIYGGYPSLDGCPLAEGDIADIADGTQFIGLQKYFNGECLWKCRDKLLFETYWKIFVILTSICV